MRDTLIIFLLRDVPYEILCPPFDFGVRQISAVVVCDPFTARNYLSSPLNVENFRSIRDSSSDVDITGVVWP